MNIVDAEEFAKKLMSEWLHPVWKFGWSKSRESIGDCTRDPDRGIYRIRLSEPYVRTNPREAIEETIRHELAHALSSDVSGHGPEWQANAIRVGAVPEEFAGEEVAAPAHKWQATCPVCGQVNGRHRWVADMDDRLACPGCCREFNGGEWDKRFMLTYEKQW